MWGVGVYTVLICFLNSSIIMVKVKKDQSQQKHPLIMKTKPFENKWSQGKDRK